jgi:hypothetical protein
MYGIRLGNDSISSMEGIKIPPSLPMGFGQDQERNLEIGNFDAIE